MTEPDAPGKGWKRNEGRMPHRKGARVMVLLRNGDRAGEEPVSKETKAGWQVETTRWTLLNDPFDVIWFKKL